MFLLDKRIISHFNYELILFIIPIIYLSYNLIFEINEILAQKQLIYFTISLFIFIFILFLPIRKLLNLIPFFYWIGIVLLLLVLIVGTTKLGATRWLSIPFTNYTIQPSELIKPVFLLMMCYLIYQKPPSDNGYNLSELIYFSFYILLPFLLILKEPDLGTALILLFVGYGILFIVGINIKIVISSVIILFLLAPVYYKYFMEDYQKKRVEDFLSKEPSYHVKQSLIAIGSGGIYGQQKEEATQTQLKFLPISTSDFIFAYLVERYGFLGGIGLIFFYTILIIYLLILNFKFKDYLINVFASGLALLIFFNMVVNILMVIGFAPVVGLPLPLFSYGGSSFVNFVTMFAILENLITFRFKASYDFNKRF